MEGWIKLHRRILQWEWWSEPKTLKVFLFLLLEATHTTRKYRGFEVKRGQLWVSERQMGANLGMTYQEVRTSLLKLKLTNEITTKATHKRTLITISNYERYQLDEKEIQRNEQRNEQRNNNEIITQETTQKQRNDNALSTHKITQKQRNDNAISTQSNNLMSECYNENLGKDSENFDEKRSSNLTHYNKNDNNNNIVVGDIAKWLSNQNDQFKESILMQLHLKPTENIDELFKCYQRELICQGVESEKENEIKTHFINMMRIKLSWEKKNGHRSNTVNNAPSSKEQRQSEFAEHIAAQVMGH